MAKKSIAELLAKNMQEKEKNRAEFVFPEKILHPTIEAHVLEKGKRYQHWWEELTGNRHELTLHMCSKPDDLTYVAELYLVAGQDNAGTHSGTSGEEIEQARKQINALGYELRGTFHTHPGLGCFFSGADDCVNEDTLNALKGSHYELVKARKIKALDDVQNFALKDGQELRWSDRFLGKDYSLSKTADGKFEFAVEESNYVAYVYAVVADGEKHICGMLSQRISNNLNEKYPVDKSKTRSGAYIKIEPVEKAQKNWTDANLIIDIIEKQSLDPLVALNRIRDPALKLKLFETYKFPTAYPIALAARKKVSMPTEKGLQLVEVMSDSPLEYAVKLIELNYPDAFRNWKYLPKETAKAPVINEISDVVQQPAQAAAAAPAQQVPAEAPSMFAKPGELSGEKIRARKWYESSDKDYEQGLFEYMFGFPLMAVPRGMYILTSEAAKAIYRITLKPALKGVYKLCRRAKKDPDCLKKAGDDKNDK